MLDFNSEEFLLRAILDDRERALRPSHRNRPSRPGGNGLRAALARCLAGIALLLDREAAGSRVAGDWRTAGGHTR